MAYLGFFKELGKQFEIGAKKKAVRGTFNETIARGNKHLEGIEGELLEKEKASIRSYQEQYGIPQEGASPEAKEAYDKALDGMLAKTNALRTKVLNDYGKGIAKEEHMIRQGLAMSPDTDFSKEEVENIMSEAWGVGEMHAGILDVLNQTASARATALGVTRFRGTDGAMSTMGSIGSLFLKNNNSLTNEASIALLAGGTLTAGMAVGKAVGAAGSAIGSND